MALVESVLDKIGDDIRMQGVSDVEHVVAIANASLGIAVRKVLGHAVKSQ